MKSRFLLDVVVTQSATVLELLSSKDKTLLIRRNTFLVLDLGLDIVNSIRWFHIQSDGLSSQGLDKNLHSSSEAKDQVKGGLLLDVVVTQGSAIFKLLSGEDETLLIRRDSFLVLDLGLDIIDGIGGFDVQSDSLSSQGLDKNLHSSSEAKDQVKGGLLLDVVVTQGSAIFKLLSGEDETLLIRRDSFLVLDLGLDIIDGIGGFDVQSDGLPSKSFYEDLQEGTKERKGVREQRSSHFVNWFPNTFLFLLHLMAE